MRILQLTTYPIVEPRHGGQIRVDEIRKRLISEGNEVLSLSVSEFGHTNFNSQTDCLVDMSTFPNPYNLPFCNDFLTSIAVLQKRKVFKFLYKRVKDFSPDIIFCEQPFLWPFVKKMYVEGILRKQSTYLVYSSQNIESRMKNEMLVRHGISQEEGEKLVNDIALLEKDLVEHADNTICVTDFDATYFSQYTENPLVVCRNGVRSQAQVNCGSKIVKELTSNRPYLFLCGSAHSPNAIGFWEMFGPSLAHLPPETMIVVAGGIYHVLWEYEPQDSNLSTLVNRDIINCVGMVSDEVLTALIDGSKGIILPITFGGGSNLKTAEAIASFKPTVATPTACRGFDFVDKLSNFYVTNDSQEFIKKSRDILLNNISFESISSDEKKLRESVYWVNALAPLESVLDGARDKLSLSSLKK